MMECSVSYGPRCTSYSLLHSLLMVLSAIRLSSHKCVINSVFTTLALTTGTVQHYGFITQVLQTHFTRLWWPTKANCGNYWSGIFIIIQPAVSKC